MTLTFTESCAIADCAARVLADQRPANGGDAFLRQFAVIALRALWNSGDADARRAVIGRVHIWLKTPDARRQQAYRRAVLKAGGTR